MSPGCGTRSEAGARQILTWRWDHWHIENRLHWVRDTAFREDHCRVCTGHGPHHLAAFRNAAISVLRQSGDANIAAALRENAYRIDRLFAKPGILELGRALCHHPIREKVDARPLNGSTGRLRLNSTNSDR